jgi:hypothetical protein
VRKLVLLLLLSGCGESTIVGPPGPEGPQGPPGIQGPAGSSSLIEWVDPCPDIPVAHPELLALIGGEYFAVYASGEQVFLTRLQLNITYRTTDIRQCLFMINETGVVR